MATVRTLKCLLYYSFCFERFCASIVFKNPDLNQTKIIHFFKYYLRSFVSGNYMRNIWFKHLISVNDDGK